MRVTWLCSQSPVDVPEVPITDDWAPAPGWKCPQSCSPARNKPVSLSQAYSPVVLGSFNPWSLPPNNKATSFFLACRIEIRDLVTPV